MVRDSPAFKTGMAPGVRITQVNSMAFTVDALLSAVAASVQQPVSFDFERDGKTHHGVLDSHGGPRYPALRRAPGVPDRLSALLMPRV
ncbi:hypothetical protein [Xanthomonas sp. NCPPB 2632]|uniref:hypothetical protein n=1 Tax=Xanthomonas sp. NCPPB 2632 TaxID=3240912 RepID=UPI003514717D